MKKILLRSRREKEESSIENNQETVKTLLNEYDISVKTGKRKWFNYRY